jgi:hypothetical protein
METKSLIWQRSPQQNEKRGLFLKSMFNPYIALANFLVAIYGPSLFPDFWGPINAQLPKMFPLEKIFFILGCFAVLGIIKGCGCVYFIAEKD